MQKAKKYIISGGGTGGHIYPAIAIANELQNKDPEAEVLFVGAKGKMEMQKVPEAGYKIYGLWISGIRRSLSLQNLLFPFKLLSSLVKSWRILRRHKPDAVIGVGGFASGPLLYMASLMKTPTLIQEQNGYPGITNKLLAKRVDKICVAFENLDRYFPKEKIVITGNPTREQIQKKLYTKEQAQKHFGLDQSKKTLLVIGGSLGARSINESILFGFEKIEESDIQIIWQTGKSFHHEIEIRQGFRSEFITEMGLAYTAADVVISRAGAISLSELCLMEKATIFVPYPHAAEDHQTKNAQGLVQKKAAIVIADSKAREDLVETALNLLSDPEQITQLEQKIKEFAKPSAVVEIANHINQLIAKD
jgi:UDP-N-acetylglucosamine--N-acetylmuramyl-(pentapeptide) pyrophosphoryl-undecaprenol N-acetylglucosamine transferase